MTAIKRTPADDAFSKCVRERANWTCERCGKYYPEGYRQGLHCSHYFGRGVHSVRYDPLNAFSICHGCHQFLGSRPHDHTVFVREKLGPRLYDILLEKKNQILRKADRNVKEIAKHYREEFKKMEDQRKQGVTGRIEFVGWI